MVRVGDTVKIKQCAFKNTTFLEEILSRGKIGKVLEVRKISCTDDHVVKVSVGRTEYVLFDDEIEPAGLFARIKS